MIFRNLYPGMDDVRISLLKQLLNELLKPSPNLIINNKYDDETKSALKRFEIGIEERLDSQNKPFKVNAYGRPSIAPADGKIDSATWILIAMALKQLAPERLRSLVERDRDLSDLFGLLPGTIEVNKYPPFSAGDLKQVKDALDSAKKMVRDSIKKDNFLKDKYGVASVLEQLNGVIVEGEGSNTFDGRQSYQLSWDKNLTRTVKQYFIDNKASVGAIVQFDAGPKGKNVMFIGDYFFNPPKPQNIAQQRSFIITHESVHLVSGKTDEDFGGSKKLSLLLVEAFFPVLKGNLGGVA